MHDNAQYPRRTWQLAMWSVTLTAWASTAMAAAGPAIVLPEQCPADRKRTAHDLAEILHRMTGVAPPVVTPSQRPEGPAILLGSELAPAPVRAGLTEAQLGFDGYIIRSLDERTLLLCGRTEPGHANAVYGWLRELGGRWFMPGPHGEVIPQVGMPQLGGWDRRERPAYIHRRLWYSSVRARSEATAQEIKQMRDELSDWQRRNRMGSPPLSFGHNFAKVISPAKLFDAHPEYFPERGGVRVPDGQLCTTNEQVIERFADAAVAEFDRLTDLQSFSLSPNDGRGWCHCPHCEALDPPSARGTEAGKADRLVTFANAVARRVRSRYPDRWLAFYAYKGCVAPPTYADPDDNVLVVLAHAVFDHLRSIDDPRSAANVTFNRHLVGWGAVAEQMFVREYYCRWWAPWPMWPAVASDIPYLWQHHITGFNAELECRSEGCEIGWYLLAELSWDPGQDADKLTQDYFRGLYGSAAPAMKAYFLILREAESDPALRARGGADEIPKLFPAQRIDRARQQLEAALALAVTPPQQFQVRRSIDAMDAMQAYWALESARKAFDAALDPPTASAVILAGRKLKAINDRIRRYDPARYWSTPDRVAAMLHSARVVLGEVKIDPWAGDFRGDSFGQKALSFARMIDADGLQWSDSVDNGYIYGNGTTAAWYIRHDRLIQRALVNARTYDSGESAGWLQWRLSFDRGVSWQPVERVDLDGWVRRRIDLTDRLTGRQDFVLGVYFAPGSNVRARLTSLSITIE